MVWYHPLSRPGGITCDLVEEQLLGDKTALRRLVKHIVTVDAGVGGAEREGEGVDSEVASFRGGLTVLSDDRWLPVLRGCSSSSSGSSGTGTGTASSGNGGVGGGGVTGSSIFPDQDACEDSTALAHITRIHLSARLYLLTKDQGPGLGLGLSSSSSSSSSSSTPTLSTTSTRAMAEAKAAVQGLIYPQLQVQAVP